MPGQSESHEADRLKSLIRNLAEENEMLLERAKDLLLLGTLSEKTMAANSAEGVIRAVLEILSCHKGLSYCAFLLLGDAISTVQVDYAPDSRGSLSGRSFPLNPDTGTVRMAREIFTNCPQFEPLASAIQELLGLSPSFSCCFVPISRGSSTDALFCVSKAKEGRFVQNLEPLLQRIGDLIKSRLEAISLLTDLSELNRTLENKVHERTLALELSNSQLKASDEVLRQSEERYRTLAELAQDVIFIVDQAGNLRYINTYGASILHAAPENLIGKDLAEIFPAAFAERQKASILAAAETGKPVYIEEQFDLDGREIWLDTRLVPMADNDNRYTSVLGIARDVSSRKQMQELNEQLERQLFHAQKMEAVGRLAGGVAHDFNNLLTAILGYCDLIQAKYSGQEALYKDLRQIQKAAERAASLTQQLLAFSRKQVMQPKIIDLAEAVLDLQPMLQRLLGEDIELAMACTLGNSVVLADPGKIHQVVLNLAVNARDAMPKGGKLTIETSNVDLDERNAGNYQNVRPGSYVMLAVSDTGCGMDLETQSHLFEPFFTTKEIGKGTGLGLATVHGIVNQSGGYIWVYSEVGAGTTFKIYLPRHRAEYEESAPPERREPIPEGVETILVVEDSTEVRGFICQSLQLRGYRVLEAADGALALDVCRREPGVIQLLLTDVVMPGISGPELARRLSGLRPEMKVLYMSGYTDDAVVRHGLMQPKEAFIQKPFRSEDLIRKIRMLLDER